MSIWLQGEFWFIQCKWMADYFNNSFCDCFTIYRKNRSVTENAQLVFLCVVFKLSQLNQRMFHFIFCWIFSFLGSLNWQGLPYGFQGIKLKILMKYSKMCVNILFNFVCVATIGWRITMPLWIHRKIFVKSILALDMT